MAPSSDVILEVRDLVKHFPLTQGILFKKQIGAVKAVDGVDLDLHAGETLGIVGESGCGKSTLAKLLMVLERPTSGSVKFEGQDIFRSGGRESAPRPPQHPDRLSGPVLVPEPPNDGRRHRG